MPNDEADFTVRLIDEVSRPARSAASSIKGIDSAFAALETAGITAAVVGVTALAAAAVTAATAVGSLAVSFASAALDGADFAQSSNIALTSLLHSAPAAAEAFDDVRHEAQRLGLDVQDTVQAFTKLSAAQFAVEESKELIAMSADLQIVTNSADAAQRAILAITQIKSKGTFQIEELGQLREAGVADELVFQALEKQLGGTRKELLKLISAGGIDSATGIAAVLDAVKAKTGVKDFGDLAEQAGEESIRGMKRVFDAKIDNLFTDIGEAIEPLVTPIFKKIFSLFDTIASNPQVQALGPLLLHQLEIFGNWVDENWPQIEAAVVSGVEFIAQVVRESTKVVDFFRYNWDTVSLALQGFGEIIKPFAMALLGAIEVVAAATVAVGAFIAGVSYAVGWVTEHIGEIPNAIQDAVSNATSFLSALPAQMFQAGVGLVQGLIDGVRSMIGSAVASVAGLGEEVIGTFRSTLGIASPSKEFEAMGAFSAEGFAGGISANDTTVKGASADMASNALGSLDGGGGGGGGGITFSPTFNIQQQPGQSSSELADEISSRCRREFESLLEQANIEAA